MSNDNQLLSCIYVMDVCVLSFTDYVDSHNVVAVGECRNLYYMFEWLLVRDSIDY